MADSQRTKETKTKSNRACLLSSLTVGTVVIGCCAALLPQKLLGFAPEDASHAIEVATHMGAKIACSARYISNFTAKRIVEDLGSYSPINYFVTFHYDDEAKSVTADLFGFGSVTAQYYPATGCSLLLPYEPSSASCIGSASDDNNNNDKETLRQKKSPLLASLKSPTLLRLVAANANANKNTDPNGDPNDDTYSNSEWPGGDRVSTIDPLVQTAAEAMFANDTARGLKTRALVVVREGRIVAEVYEGLSAADGSNVTARTPLLGWSMAKSVVGMLLGRLAREGHLSVTESGLFPEWRGGGGGEEKDKDKEGEEDERFTSITVEQLLQMRSGLDFDERYVPGADATRMLFSSPSAAEYALRSPMLPNNTNRNNNNNNKRGNFYYSSGTTNILSRLLSRRVASLLHMKDGRVASSSSSTAKASPTCDDNSTKTDPQATIDFAARELFAPLGMRGWVFETDASGDFVGSSYLYASARDWARLGTLLLQKGRWLCSGRCLSLAAKGDNNDIRRGDKKEEEEVEKAENKNNNGEMAKKKEIQLLDEDWVEKATTPNPSENEKAYGYHLWLNSGDSALRWPELPADAFAMHGNRHQIVMVVPSANSVIVRLGWTKTDYPIGPNFEKIIDATKAKRKQ